MDNDHHLGRCDDVRFRIRSSRGLLLVISTRVYDRSVCQQGHLFSALAVSYPRFTPSPHSHAHQSIPCSSSYRHGAAHQRRGERRCGFRHDGWGVHYHRRGCGSRQHNKRYTVYGHATCVPPLDWNDTLIVHHDLLDLLLCQIDDSPRGGKRVSSSPPISHPSSYRRF